MCRGIIFVVGGRDNGRVIFFDNIICMSEYVLLELVYEITKFFKQSLLI